MTITTDQAKDKMQESFGDFLDSIDALHSPVDWPNAPFDSVDLGDFAGTPVECWAAVRFNFGDRSNAALGSTPQYRTLGIATVMIFTALNTGEAVIDGIAESIRSNYEGGRIDSGNIKIRNPQITTVGVSNGWWQVNVSLPFEFDSQ